MRGKILFLVSLFTICLLGIETLGQDSEIVAKIGDEIIKKEDLEVRKPKTTLGSVEEIGKKSQVAMDEKRALNETIDLTLLAAEAKKTDLMNSPTLKAKIRYHIDGLIVQEYVGAYIDSLIPVSENEILDFYKTNPKYQQKEVIRARNIVVKTREEAKEILNKIKAGEDFSKLANERSIDKATRGRGGDLGWFDKRNTAEPFREIVSILKEGEVSDVFKTVEGFHIIKLEDRKTSPPAELEKMRSEITQEIKSTKKKEFISKRLEALRASTPIEILSDKFKDPK